MCEKDEISLKEDSFKYNRFYSLILFCNKKVTILTNSSISLSPRSNRSSLESWESDSGKDLSKFSLNSNDCNASKL